MLPTRCLSQPDNHVQFIHHLPVFNLLFAIYKRADVLFSVGLFVCLRWASTLISSGLHYKQRQPLVELLCMQGYTDLATIVCKSDFFQEI